MSAVQHRIRKVNQNQQQDSQESKTYQNKNNKTIRLKKYNLKILCCIIKNKRKYIQIRLK